MIDKLTLRVWSRWRELHAAAFQSPQRRPSPKSSARCDGANKWQTWSETTAWWRRWWAEAHSCLKHNADTVQLTWNRHSSFESICCIYTGLLHTSSFPIGYFLEMVEMLRKFWKLQSQQISEHGHVHWEGTQVIGEVTIGKHFINQIDHHLSKNNNKR